jgi:hypothetical protein
VVDSLFEFFSWCKGRHSLGWHFDLFAGFLWIVRFASVSIATLKRAESNQGYAIALCYYVLLVRAAISAASSALFTEFPPCPYKVSKPPCLLSFVISLLCK